MGGRGLDFQAPKAPFAWFFDHVLFVKLGFNRSMQRRTIQFAGLRRVGSSTTARLSNQPGTRLHCDYTFVCFRFCICQRGPAPPHRSCSMVLVAAGAPQQYFQNTYYTLQSGRWQKQRAPRTPAIHPRTTQRYTVRNRDCRKYATEYRLSNYILEHMYIMEYIYIYILREIYFRI